MSAILHGLHRRVLLLERRLAGVIGGTLGSGGGGGGITDLTGDVTGTGPGSTATTIANDAVDNAKLADMPAHTVKGNNTGSAANPDDLTMDELSAELDTATDPFLRTSAASAGGITQLTGDVTAGPGSGSQAATLANSGVTPDTYGSTDRVPVVTVDAKGRVTAASSVVINSNSAALTPTDVAGLAVWLKADAGVFNDAGSTPAADTDTVQQWNDQSGNGNHATQATSGKRPTYRTGIKNSLPVIRFAGAHCLQIAALAQTTFTLLFAFRNTAANAVLIEQSATVGSNDGFLVFSASGGASQVKKGGVLSSRNYATGWGETGQYWVTGQHYGGSHATHFRIETGGGIGIGATATGNEPGTGSTSDVINIGSRNDAASAFMTGDMLEILLYTPAVSVQNMRGLVQYLQRKWDL